MSGATLLSHCHIVDVVGGAVVRDAAVLIEDGRIAYAGPAAALDRPGVREVDLGGGHVAPGLINLHVHLGLALPGRQKLELAAESDAALALRMAANARATLRAGVTTVRLVGERNHVDLALRAAITAGAVDGPRILTAGQGITCTGGHGHDAGFVEMDGPSAVRAAVRRQIRAGADWIKLCISGGIAGLHETIHESQLLPDEIAAATQVAHAWSRKVTAHAGPAQAIRVAIEHGLDCVEHGYLLDEDTVRLMAERGIWLVPTIGVTRCKEFYDKVEAPRWMVDKALENGEHHWRALELAIAHGVPIGLGTDMFPHEPFEGTSATVRELEFYVEAGMSNLAAIRAATLAPARLLGLEAEIGSVEEGKIADLVVLGGDPLADVSAFRDLRLVLQAGRAVP